jgi:UDPglucose 6-dehydrogenase
LVARSSVSVVGLGKLGLCLAAILARKGYEVVGVDVNPATVEAVNRGLSPIFEPGLAKIIRANRKRLRATSDFEEILPTRASFVVVPTPSDATGMFSLRFVLNAMENLGWELAKKKGYHLVVLVSTVMPGSMEGFVRPLLERVSGKTCGPDFGLCYSPEFIALGDVIHGMTEPDFVLIGESDRKAGAELTRIQRQICKNNPPIERMSFTNAELAKISVNSFVTMKMSFANTLAEICERMPGGDVDRVTAALGRDRRIGASYLRGAQGYGGPCFPRDNVAFATFTRSLGAQAELALATHKVNLSQVRRVLAVLKEEHIRPPSKIGVLGLSYKPSTNVLEASQSLELAKELKAEGYEVLAFDPAIPADTKELASASIVCARSIRECVDAAQVCVIATPWKEFYEQRFENKILVDLWRFPSPASRTAAKYIPIGRNREASTTFPSEYLEKLSPETRVAPAI